MTLHSLQWGTDCECKGSQSRSVMQCVCWPLHWEQLWEIEHWDLQMPYSDNLFLKFDPELSHMACFRQLLHLGLWEILSVFCVTGILETSIHSKHSFQTWLNRTPASASELAPAFLWKLGLNRLLIGTLSWMSSMRAANMCACEYVRLNTFNLLKCTLQVSNYAQTNCINVFS